MNKELALKLAAILHSIRDKDSYGMTLNAISQIGDFVKEECVDPSFSEKEFYDTVFLMKVFDCQYK